MRSKCAVTDCNDLSRCHGYCQKHYVRWKKHGDPLKGQGPAKWDGIHCTTCGGLGPFMSTGRTCAVCHKKKSTRWREANPEKALEVSRVSAVKSYRAARTEALAQYGGRCSCCGESRPVFLVIDHIHGGGNAHRRALGRNSGGSRIQQFLKKQGYPPGYQVLCHNCNFARSHGGCPHQEIRDDDLWSRVITIDVESGGLEPEHNALLTLALVNGDASLELLIADRDGECTPEAMAVNQIDLAQHMLVAISPVEAAQQVVSFLERIAARYPPKTKLWVAGHNVSFDIEFSWRLFRLAGRARPRILGHHRTIDTHTLLWQRYAKGEIPFEATSSEGAFEHYGITVNNRHTALGDAIATQELLRKLLAC